MPRITIPQRYVESLSKIGRLDEQTVLEIRAALDRSGSDTSHTPSDVAQRALTSLAPSETADFKRIAEVLGMLYALKSTRDTSIEEFADDVCDAMEAVASKEFRLAPQQRAKFKEKLLALLGADEFGVASKAWDLRTDDERVFCHARILTDLRPVFGARVEDGPKAMVLVHILKLGYDLAGNSEKHEDVYVSLDSEDLQLLKSAIERAESKAKALASSVKNVRLFGLSRD